MRLITSNIGLRLEIEEDVASDIVRDLRTTYDEAGRDMPKHLNDAVFDLEVQLGILKDPTCRQ